MSAGMTLADLANFRIWVGWQTELRKDGKPTKIPYSAGGSGKAKSNAPATWGTRTDATTCAEQLRKPLGVGGVGVMFAPLPGGLHLGGIDLDTCRNPETCGLEPWAEEIVKRLNSYTEVSPSRTGVKIFFTYDRNVASGLRQSAKFDRGKGDHPPAIEFYLAGRYFTVTDQQVNGFSALRTIPLEDLKWVVNVAGPAFKGEPARREEGGKEEQDEKEEKEEKEEEGKGKQDEERQRSRPTLTIEDLAAAFEIMENDDLSGDDWVMRGNALKFVPGDDHEKFLIFDRWSRKCTAKYNATYTRERWDKFKPDGRRGTGSIVFWAREADPKWKPASCDEAQNFRARFAKVNGLTPDEMSEVIELASCGDLQYARARKDAAKRLGARVAVLDALVNRYRGGGDANVQQYIESDGALAFMCRSEAGPTLIPICNFTADRKSVV